MKDPNYTRIYADLIEEKFPEKKVLCEKFFEKENPSALDIININTLLFGNKRNESQQHRSYDRKTILEILEYQKINGLNNIQLADHFKLSRNTVAKWKKYII